MMKPLDKSVSCIVTLAIEILISVLMCPIGIITALAASKLGISLLIAGPASVFVLLLLGWAILYGLGN